MSLDELPGAELILPGLNDLSKGETHTVGSLLVAIAATPLNLVTSINRQILYIKM
jgi:hypothetical protein